MDKAYLLAGLMAIFLVANFLYHYDGLPGSMDSWYHMRIASHVAGGGKPAWDIMANYPPGESMTYPPLLHYLIGHLSLATGLSVFVAGNIIMLSSGLMAVYAAYRLSSLFMPRNWALLSSIFLGSMPVFAYQTLRSSIDHDPLSLLFIISFAYFFLRKGDISAALAGLSIAALSFTWPGFVLLPAAFCLYSLAVCACSIRHRMPGNKGIRHAAITLAFSSIAMALHPHLFWVLLMLYAVSIASLFASVRLKGIRKAIAAAMLLSLLAAAIFLDARMAGYVSFIGITNNPLFSSVLELQPLSPSTALSLYGVLLLPAALCIFRERRKPDPRGIFITSLFASLLALAILGAKFAFFASVAVAFMAALGAREIRRRLIPGRRAAMAILAALVLASMWASFSYPKNDYPLFPEWSQSLEWLKANSPPGSVVMCWWDNSPWVNYIAEQPTAFNNQNQRTADMRSFFQETDPDAAKSIADKYNISYVIVDTGMLSKISPGLEMEILPVKRQGDLLMAMSGDYAISFNETSRRAWKTYRNGTLCVGAAAFYGGGDVYAENPGCERGDFIYAYSNYMVHIWGEAVNNTYLSLQFMPSNPLGYERVYSNGAVKAYLVKR